MDHLHGHDHAFGHGHQLLEQEKMLEVTSQAATRDSWLASRWGDNRVCVLCILFPP